MGKLFSLQPLDKIIFIFIIFFTEFWSKPGWKGPWGGVPFQNSDNLHQFPQERSPAEFEVATRMKIWIYIFIPSDCFFCLVQPLGNQVLKQQDHHVY